MPKPSIFIGSSTEGRAVADALRANLRDAGEVTVWYQGVFGLSASTLESLLRELDQTNFAIIVFTADDFGISRGESQATPRDNGLFELGLFMGRLGRSCTYAVVSDADKLKIPSDLKGITFATYTARGDGDLVRAVGDAAVDIRRAITQETDRLGEQVLNALSGRLIYMLRHLDQIDQFRHESFYAKALAHFECETEMTQSQVSFDPKGWAKASVYACRLCGALGLVEYSKTSGEVLITRLGREVVADPRAKRRFGNAYDTAIVSI